MNKKYYVSSNQRYLYNLLYTEKGKYLKLWNSVQTVRQYSNLWNERKRAEFFILPDELIRWKMKIWKIHQDCKTIEISGNINVAVILIIWLRCSCLAIIVEGNGHNEPSSVSGGHCFISLCNNSLEMA